MKDYRTPNSLSKSKLSMNSRWNYKKEKKNSSSRKMQGFGWNKVK
jgi:hypothetical protein